MSDEHDDAPTDDQLLELIAAANERHDPVAPSAQRFALESHRLLSFEAELAEIAADSLVDAGAERSSATVRTVEFAFSRGSLRLECGAELSGLINPPQDLRRLHLEVARSEPTDVDVSPTGFFMCAAPSGPFRLVLTLGDDVVRTEWIQA